MSDDNLRTAILAIAALRRQLAPLSAQIAALQSSPGVQRLIANADHARMQMRAALGPVEDLRRILQRNPGLLQTASELRGFRKLAADLEKQFLLPKQSDIQKLLGAWETSGAQRALLAYRDHASQFRLAIEAMNTPWVDSQNELRSLKGLLGLQQVGHELRSSLVFDVKTAERLRRHLGDWREKVDWPSAIYTDAWARSDFYVDRGLDPDLTNFPADAFSQAMTNAGIQITAPPYVHAYAATENERGEEQTGFERNNAAHDRLQRFESHLRAFIDQRMTTTVGENWIKHRVSRDMHRQWKGKRAKAIDVGEPERPLIAYADFTDYAKIIERKDNWNEAFAPVFRRKSLVQESLQRLYPIRNCTMHARIITQDDELFLHAETRRLLKAMGAQA